MEIILWDELVPMGIIYVPSVIIIFYSSLIHVMRKLLLLDYVQSVLKFTNADI